MFRKDGLFKYWGKKKNTHIESKGKFLKDVSIAKYIKKLKNKKLSLKRKVDKKPDL